jgi:mannose-6-phosphate isomerase-like protein (cupin superfamily)
MIEMSQQMAVHTIFYADTKAQAVFGETGPQPRFLLDSEPFKVLVAGLDAGQQIPTHPESAAMYHFLEGVGMMTVDDQQFPVGPGSTVIALAGARRGLQAGTRLIFLATKAGEEEK